MVWNLNGLWLSIDWDCHHPNWRTHIFQRGRSTTNQIKYPMKVNNLSLYVRGILPFPILVFFRCTDDSRSLITCGNLWLKTDVLHGATMVAPWLSPKPMRFTIDPDMNVIQCYTSLNFLVDELIFFAHCFQDHVSTQTRECSVSLDWQFWSSTETETKTYPPAETALEPQSKLHQQCRRQSNSSTCLFEHVWRMNSRSTPFFGVIPTVNHRTITFF